MIWKMFSTWIAMNMAIQSIFCYAVQSQGIKIDSGYSGTVKIRSGTTQHTFSPPETNDNVKTWLSVHSGVYPDIKSEHPDEEVKVGEPVTMLVYLSNHENKYDVKAKDCWAYDGPDYKSNKTNNIQLTDENGCPIKSKLINYWSKTNDDTTRNTKLIYTNLTAFRFPNKEHVYLSCNIEVCFESCKIDCIEKRSASESNIKTIRLTRGAAGDHDGQLRLPDLAVLLGFKQRPQTTQAEKPAHNQISPNSINLSTTAYMEPISPPFQATPSTLCYLGSTNPACDSQDLEKAPPDFQKRPLNRVYPLDPPHCFQGSTDPRCPTTTPSPNCDNDPQSCFVDCSIPEIAANNPKCTKPTTPKPMTTTTERRGDRDHGHGHGHGNDHDRPKRVKCYPGSTDRDCPLLCWPGFMDVNCPILCCPGCPYNEKCVKPQRPSNDNDPPICKFDSWQKDSRCPKICYEGSNRRDCDVVIPISSIPSDGQWVGPYPHPHGSLWVNVGKGRPQNWPDYNHWGPGPSKPHHPSRPDKDDEDEDWPPKPKPTRWPKPRPDKDDEDKDWPPKPKPTKLPKPNKPDHGWEHPEKPHGGPDKPHGGHGGPDGPHGGHGWPDKPHGGHGWPDKPHGGHGGPDKPHGGHGGPDKPHGGHGGPDKPHGGHGGPDGPHGGHGGPDGSHGGHGWPDKPHGGPDKPHGGHGGPDKPYGGHGGPDKPHGEHGGHENPNAGYGPPDMGWWNTQDHKRPSKPPHHADRDGDSNPWQQYPDWMTEKPGKPQWGGPHKEDCRSGSNHPDCKYIDRDDEGRLCYVGSPDPRCKRKEDNRDKEQSSVPYTDPFFIRQNCYLGTRDRRCPQDLWNFLENTRAAVEFDDGTDR